jgi:hypothetical protein
MERVKESKRKENDKNDKRGTTMRVVGDEKRVGYRCRDEIGVGMRMRLPWGR